MSAWRVGRSSTRKSFGVYMRWLRRVLCRLDDTGRRRRLGDTLRIALLTGTADSEAYPGAKAPHLRV